MVLPCCRGSLRSGHGAQGQFMVWSFWRDSCGLAGQDREGILAPMTDLDCMSAWKTNSKALMVVAAALCGNLGSSGVLAGEANWPQFRGAGARGVTSSTNLAEHWSRSENVAWKAEIRSEERRVGKESRSRR